MGVMHLNDDNFVSVTSKGVHFVKFYAPWYDTLTHGYALLIIVMIRLLRCGHCQKLAPTWSDLAAYFNTHNKDVHIVKVFNELVSTGVEHYINRSTALRIK